MCGDPEMEREGVLLRCYFPDCGYEWRYSGNSTIYASCPGCRRGVKIKVAEVK